ncbi:MAG: toll/interleukin-1 receptor domain-containing protein [Egibacteraceae bacterium]
MPDIFINYRTGDEEASATLIDQKLSDRFGPERVFRASKSIPLGEDYIRALLTAVRKSEVLLAVIGPRWLTAVDRQGRKRLHNETDWTRREILEAFKHGVRVVPILVGDTPLLDPSVLPPELAGLADCQYYRLYLRSADANLRTLGDELAKLVPSLAAHDQAKKAPESDAGGRGSTTLRAGDNAHQQTGGTHSVVTNAQGPVHTGVGPQFNGDGGNYVEGGNSGGIHQTFSTSRKRPSGGR